MSDMINFERINNSSEKNFSKMYELYRTAFPPSERRSMGGLEHILNYEKRFEAYALMKEGEFVGFFTFWTFDRFVYAEHFAVDDNLRGQNIGSEVMREFLAMLKLPLIFEVEMPNDPNAIRRIKFYERFGLKTVSYPYAQPYYDGSGKLLPMIIMTNDSHFADKHYKMIKNTLYSEVYNYHPEEN